MQETWIPGGEGGQEGKENENSGVEWETRRVTMTREKDDGRRKENGARVGRGGREEGDEMANYQH